MSQSPFQKFVAPKKNSVVKEQFRQEKKKVRKEKNAYFDKLKEEKYQARMAKKGKPVAAAPRVEEKATATKGTAAKITTGKGTPAVRTTDVVMPLNKFLAHCGVCSRREAVGLIAEGKVKLNGQIATEPGYKVQPTDDIQFNNKKLFVTKNLVYILLNKPKDYITTTDDPQGRKTVLQLISRATEERVYPIGRLDRNTSGVLLLTNDGDLTQKLSHPSYEIKKIYEVKLDKPLIKNDFEKILDGLTLEDGQVLVDSLAYADSKDKSIIGIEIHSGRNRIVRRIFEHLGYDVKGLDRVMYAGLTKKNVERSKWRYLSDKEIRLLKYMNESKKKGSKAPLDPEEKPSTKQAKPEKVKEKRLTSKEIAEAIGEAVPEDKKAIPVREVKIPKARKFKSHSEAKKHKKDNVGKK
ncbi:MAG: pseudouridine synthase Rsu [Ferruginibacter sp.]|nr:pseudouridine synthase Rsu [Ferruginibacter sp.]